MKDTSQKYQEAHTGLHREPTIPIDTIDILSRLKPGSIHAYPHNEKKTNKPLMNMENKIIKKLCTNIHNGHFDSEKYYTPQTYYGTVICVTPLHCSYGQIGYTVNFPYTSLPEVKYDYELKKLTVDGVNWKEYFTGKINKLAALLGYNSGKHTVSACTGKWAGTMDHYVEFDNGKKLFICNGAEHFDKSLTEIKEKLEKINKTRTRLLEMLKEQAETDSMTASREGLARCHPKEILTIHDGRFLWTAVRLSVSGKEFNFIETSLAYALEDGPEKLKEHIRQRNSGETYTAGAVKTPTFVFMNVRFSHEDGLYMIQNEGA